MKKEVKKYESFREDYIKKITKNLGKIVFLDNKILCYVEEKKIKRILKNTGDYLRLNGSNIKGLQDIIELYDLDKDIYYIFNKISFVGYELFIEGKNNCNIIFNHCMFDDSVKINCDGSVHFEKNKYIDSTNNKYSFSQNYLDVMSNKINIINDTIRNEEIRANTKNMSINLEGNIININNSNLITNRESNIQIKSNVLKIESSKLETYDLNIESEKMSISNSELKATNELELLYDIKEISNLKIEHEENNKQLRLR